MTKHIQEKRANNLTGKGGVGLVMFYLARRGIEFSLTSDRSDQGDIWIDGPDRLLKAEVKTCTKEAWPVRLSQIPRMDIFFFVHLLRGECWTLPASTVSELVRPLSRTSDTVPLTIKQLRKFAEGDASALCLAPIRPRIKVCADMEARCRVVQRRLATGEVKEYRYYRRRIGDDPVGEFSISFPKP